MDAEFSEAPATPVTPAAQPTTFDLVRELERLRERERRGRRVTLAIGAGFVFLFALALVQFLGTLTACRLLFEARRESARVHRETAQYLDQIHAIQEFTQTASRTLRAVDQGGTMPAAEPVRFPDATGDPRQMKRDVPADGALLVGFRVGIGREETGNGTYVASLQPIYLTAQGETLGALRGKEPSLVIHYRAKKGYAVGAMTVLTSLRFHMQLTYMRIGARLLDKGDSYQEEWIGEEGGKEAPQLLGGDGMPVVGVLATESPTGAISGLGLVRVKLTAVAETVEPTKEAPSDLEAILGEIRKAIQENRLTP